MKHSPTTWNQKKPAYGDSRLKRAVPVIPLIKPERKKLKKSDFETVDLLTDPTDVDSLRRKVEVPYLRSGTPLDFVEFRKNVEKVIAGQNATTGPQKFRILKSLVQGEAESKLNSILAEQGAETNASFLQAMNELAKHFFPKSAIAKQKRALRRNWTKPRAMNEREYVAETLAAVSDLKYYPDWQAAQTLAEDELVDIVDCGNPAGWQEQMLLQGFDISEHTLTELLEFCERLETAEVIYHSTHVSTTGGENKNNQPQSKRQKTSGSGGATGDTQQECPLHGKGHSQGQCRTLAEQGRRMRQSWEARPKSYVRSTKDGNAREMLLPHATPKVNHALMTQIRNIATETAKQAIDLVMTEQDTKLSGSKRKADDSDEDEQFGIEKLGVGHDSDTDFTDSDTEESKPKRME